MTGVKKELLLFFRQTGIPVLTDLVQDSVHTLLGGLLVGIVVPVGLASDVILVSPPLAALPVVAQPVEKLLPIATAIHSRTIGMLLLVTDQEETEEHATKVGEMSHLVA